ncbi:MAG: DUF3793 family protein [Clostridiales bacterium]|nr:DUF3793 family protein [Clostridiales bacterium]
MSREVFELVREMNHDDIETQLALQCAPVIVGLKTSNLLIVENGNMHKVKNILKGSVMSCYVLLASEKKTTILLYNKRKLDLFLSDGKVKELLEELGYGSTVLGDILPVFRARYEKYMYMSGGTVFPHEMGILLGYPVEDVKGFIINDGKNSLYTGYWKVYSNLAEKLQLFQKFEWAKETLVQLVSKGVSMEDIIHIYSEKQRYSSHLRMMQVTVQP